MRRIYFIMMTVLLGGLLMACSSSKNPFSPEQVISHALENSEKKKSYIATSNIAIYEKDKLIESYQYKEWRHEAGFIRTEMYDLDGEVMTIIVNNGQQMTTYDVENNQVFTIEDPELMELNQQSPREQTEFSLAIVQDSHDLTLKEETEIAGRKVEHIVAMPKEKNLLLGKQEMWIDKENWLVLKMTSESGDHLIEVEYESIEFNADISDEMFQIDIPDDAETIDLEDFAMGEEVSIDEAAEALGAPFLYIPEADNLEIASLEKNELEGIINRTEVDIDYSKDDLPFIGLSIFESPEEEDDLSFPGETDTVIRGQDAIFTDLEGFRSVVWDEEGFRYSILIEDPNLTLEDIQELAETMILP